MNGTKWIWTATLSLLGMSLAQQSGTVKYSGPLVITKGGTYTGNWQSNDPDVPAVLIKTAEPIVIENSNIRGRGNLIEGFYVNMTIRNTNGYGLNPRATDAFPGRFMNVEDVLNVDVENNYLEGTSGIYVHNFRGDVAKGQGVRIVRNSIKNVDGRYVDAQGKLTGKRYLVQAIQLNSVKDVPGMEIAWNQVINEPRKSGVEEVINIYESRGTAASPILIHDNYIQGAFAINPETESVYSGGGIMIGDGRQDTLANTGGYVKVYQNQVVGTSNQGIAVAGGHDQQVYDNRVLSSGLLPSGAHIAATNVGAYMWDYLHGAKSQPVTFFNNSLRNNVIGWVKWDGGSLTLNNLWTPDCTTANKSNCDGNQSWPTAVNRQAELQEFTVWQQKVKDAGVTIGTK